MTTVLPSQQIDELLNRLCWMSILISCIFYRNILDFYYSPP